jgi:hypothetical protein
LKWRLRFEASGRQTDIKARVLDTPGSKSALNRARQVKL